MRLLLRISVLLLASSAAIAVARAEEPATIEYVVRIVHLESNKPIEPDPAKASAAEISAALDGWRKTRIVVGARTFKVSGRDGEEATAEAVDERQVAAGQDKFGGRLPDPKGTIQAAEQRVAKLALRGKVDGGSIQIDFQSVETTAWEPLVEVPLDAAKNPTFWKVSPMGFTMQTTTTCKDGETVHLGGSMSHGDQQGYQARVVLITARILRPKK